MVPALLATALLTLALSATPALAAEETHFFNATLSLTGNCSTSTLDAVEDPGCPGGTHPPAGAFRRNEGIAVDKFGDRYVASFGPSATDLQAEGKDIHQSLARIDVFDPAGNFITEFGPGELEGGYIHQIAVDSAGNVYAGRQPFDNEPTLEKTGVYRYSPTVYKPASGEIIYGNPPVLVKSEPVALPIAVNPANDHLFVREGAVEHGYIAEYSSAATGNTLIDDTIAKAEGGAGEGTLYNTNFIAIDPAHNRIYANAFDQEAPTSIKPLVIRAFSLSAPHTEVLKFAGATVPTAGKFISGTNYLSIAAEEETGHFFVGELGVAKPKIYEFKEDGTFVSTIKREGMKGIEGQILIDNNPASPTHNYLFVPSGEGVPGHSLAFEPKQVAKPPVVESVSFGGVTTDEAVLQAKINPKGKQTTYRFEYTTQKAFEAEGFTGAVLAGEGMIAAANEGIPVSANLSGLAQGTAYRFRAVAQSTDGSDEKAATFATYGPPDESLECGNAGLRTGASAALPDCCAYELVTPANTNGFAPLAVNNYTGVFFPTRMSSPDGERVAFMIAGGSIPGVGGTGSRNGDPYLASRGPTGWTTASAGPNGEETSNLLHGSVSPDQGYSFWTAREHGSAVIQPGTTTGETETTYVRYPDGHSELIGRGSIATDAQLDGKLISENGGHIIFCSEYFSQPHPFAGALQLEPNAPPDGTAAIYDRTADEVTHVVSLLPGDVTPVAGENAHYNGASLDGRGVAFTIGNTLYLRRDNAKTYEIGEGVKYAGIAEGGGRVFYLKGGDLYAYDAEVEASIRFTESGDVTPVNVAAEGTAAYFLSPSVLTGETNPNDALPQPGGENLYLSEEGAIRFVGAVGKEDVNPIETNDPIIPSLGQWLSALANGGGFGTDSSRTTPDGEGLLFESRADLAGYDPQGHSEVYRYDAEADTLLCLSCNPTLAAASGDGRLISMSPSGMGGRPLSRHSLAGSLRADGQRAFFESDEALVAADTDGLNDVYEWEEEGVGSCRTEGGCTYLISSGKSAHPNYLFGVSEDGKNVFFTTTDLLLPERDPDETPSIYDARVEGGFAPAAETAGECLGEACQPAAVAPEDPTPVSASFEGQGNVTEEPSTRRSCAKGKVRRHGRCLAKKHHRKARKRHGRAGNNGRTGR